MPSLNTCLCTLGFAIAFPSAVYLAWHDKWEGMTGLLGATAMFLFFLNLDRISKFEWWGGKAETREIAREARDTINDGKLIAGVMAKTALAALQSSGLVGGVDYAFKELCRAEINAALEHLGYGKEEIGTIQSRNLPLTRVDYMYAILGGGRLPTFLPQDQQERWKAFRRTWLERPANPEDLEKFLRNNKLLNERRRKGIEDYQVFLDIGAIRDLAVFEMHHEHLEQIQP